MKTELEEIFWKEGKLIDKENNPVPVEQVGKPLIVGFQYSLETKLKDRIEFFSGLRCPGYEEVNAYLKGDVNVDPIPNVEPFWQEVAIILYKKQNKNMEK